MSEDLKLDFTVYLRPLTPMLATQESDLSECLVFVKGCRSKYCWSLFAYPTKCLLIDPINEIFFSAILGANNSTSRNSRKHSLKSVSMIYQQMWKYENALKPKQVVFHA